MTFPKREPTGTENEVFLIDCPNELETFLPDDIRKKGIRISAVERIRSTSTGNRITEEEAREYHRHGQERLDLLRTRARLVITSRYHAAVPAMAMGIPVILAHTSFDPRFEVLEQFLPLYTPEHFKDIDWNPSAVDLEEEKRRIKDAFFSAVRFASARYELKKLEKKTDYEEYVWEVSRAIRKIPFPADGCFLYAVWGVCHMDAQIIVDELPQLYPCSRMVAAIDTYQSGTYMEKPIIQPEEISTLPEDTIILVPVASAHESARKWLGNTKRKFVLIQGAHFECCNW